MKCTVGTAVEMGLVDLAMQAADGTKIPGNASTDRTYNAVTLQKLLDRTEAAIAELEAQNEGGDGRPPALTLVQSNHNRPSPPPVGSLLRSLWRAHILRPALGT